MPARMPSSATAVSHCPRGATATWSLSAPWAGAAVTAASAAASASTVSRFIEILPGAISARACAGWIELQTPRKPSLHRLAHAADAPPHRAHAVLGQMLHLVDHEAE